MNDWKVKEIREIELETKPSPNDCPGYHLYPHQRQMAKVHICNKCYNPARGYDMRWFWKKCGLEK